MLKLDNGMKNKTRSSTCDKVFNTDSLYNMFLQAYPTISPHSAPQLKTCYNADGTTAKEGTLTQHWAVLLTSNIPGDLQTVYLLTQLAGMPCTANTVNCRWSVVPEASLLLLPPKALPGWGNGGDLNETEGGQKERT